LENQIWAIVDFGILDLVDGKMIIEVKNRKFTGLLQRF
jgi:hypothetical protein